MSLELGVAIAAVAVSILALLATLAALERVPVARRTQLGEWIHEKTWGSDDPRLWGAIGRVGARVPVYASIHHVVPRGRPKRGSRAC